MNTLISIRTNIFFSMKKKEKKTDADEYVRHQEFIFLVDKASYKRTNDGEVVRERAVEELRFFVADHNFETFISALSELRKAQPDEID